MSISRYAILLLLLPACDRDAPCPEGFLRDNDGNCLQLDEDAPEPITDESCDFTIEVDAVCDRCLDYLFVSNVAYPDLQWFGTGSCSRVESGQSCTITVPSGGEVSFDWKAMPSGATSCWGSSYAESEGSAEKYCPPGGFATWTFDGCEP